MCFDAHPLTWVLSQWFFAQGTQVFGILSVECLKDNHPKNFRVIKTDYCIAAELLKKRRPPWEDENGKNRIGNERMKLMSWCVPQIFFTVLGKTWIHLKCESLLWIRAVTDISDKTDCWWSNIFFGKNEISEDPHLIESKAEFYGREWKRTLHFKKIRLSQEDAMNINNNTRRYLFSSSEKSKWAKKKVLSETFLVFNPSDLRLEMKPQKNHLEQGNLRKTADDEVWIYMKMQRKDVWRRVNKLLNQR